MESERKAEKLKEAKGGDDGGLCDVCRVHWILEITLLKVKLRKKLRTSYPGKESSNSRQSISVRNRGGVEASEITTGSPGTIRFRDSKSTEFKSYGEILLPKTFMKTRGHH